MSRTINGGGPVPPALGLGDDSAHPPGAAPAPAETAGKNGRPSRLPAVSETPFGFRLRRELGRGAFARAFVAQQAELAGRPVVLKISGIDGDEPQTLAQLQ